MPSPDQVVLFLNRRAGTGSGHQLVNTLSDSLRRRGFEAVQINAVGQLQRHVQEHQRQIRAVVAGGGDGTAELVASHIPCGVPIAILPLGTENLLAKYLQLRPDAERLAKVIAAGETRTFDAGTANGSLFLLMLSCGFDAEVVRRLHAAREGNITHLSYAWPIIDSIRNYDYPNLRVSCEIPQAAETIWEEVACHWAFVFNIPSYAAGLQIVRDADPTDGLLEVATFSGGSFWHGLWHLSAVVLGQHHQLPGFELRRARQVKIESDQAVPYQIDGDPGGFLPVQADILPKRLTLIVDSAEKSQEK